MNVLHLPNQFVVPKELFPKIYKRDGIWRVKKASGRLPLEVTRANFKAVAHAIKLNEKEYEEQEANKTSQ